MIGVRAMDDQHGVLMDTLNELRLALVQGSGRERVSEGLNRLIELTRMHFSSEERLLEVSGYPDVVEHRRAHQRLLVQIEEAAHHTQLHDELHARSLLLFLREWYTGHVETLDNQYGTWLNEHGIS
jgi:hemerythrin